MSKPVVIEIDGEPRGIVTPQPKGYRFVAVRLEAFTVDGAIFDSVSDARSAVQRAVTHYQSGGALHHDAA